MLYIFLFDERSEVESLVEPDLPDKFFGVAYHDEASLVLIQRSGNHWQVAEVDVVGRLVKHEEPGGLKHEPRKAEQAFLPFA